MLQASTRVLLCQLWLPKACHKWQRCFLDEKSFLMLQCRHCQAILEQGTRRWQHQRKSLVFTSGSGPVASCWMSATYTLRANRDTVTKGLGLQ